MSKLQDIVPPSRRSGEAAPAAGAPRRPLRISERPPRFPFATLIVVALVIAGSIGALVYFSSARVDVTPNTVSAAVQASLTANQSTGDLPFEVISAQKIATQSVQGSGTKTVTTKAKGTITIYNTAAKPQKLIATTRFATASGLIFRIDKAVSVPAGTTAKPGSVNATVTADQAGDSYNVGPTSFTVPGLAGTPQASQVYARSTTAITGGASGTVPVVDAAAEAQAKTALTGALAPDLASTLSAQVPAGYVLLPGSSVSTYEELAPAPSSSTGMVDIKVQGTITAVVFPNVALAKAIAASVPGLGYQGEALMLSSTTDLKLTPTAGMPTLDAQSFAFTLSGTAPLIYNVDPARIAAAVAGKSRSAAEVALTNYPEVKRAIIILRPFWRQSFPDDPASIKVKVAGS